MHRLGAALAVRRARSHAPPRRTLSGFDSRRLHSVVSRRFVPAPSVPVSRVWAEAVALPAYRSETAAVRRVAVLANLQVQLFITLAAAG